MCQDCNYKFTQIRRRQERVGAERPNLPQFPGGAVSENENENATEDAIVEETLVEEVSIDGMCGVY
jgi:mycofactocin precursor